MLDWNFYRKRNCKISNELSSSLCLRCNKEEGLERVIQCKGMNEMKNKFLWNLKQKSYETTVMKWEKDNINTTLKDINQCLHHNDQH